MDCLWCCPGRFMPCQNMPVSLVSWRIAPCQLPSAEVNWKQFGSVSPWKVSPADQAHILTNEPVKVRWDKNEPIRGNLGWKRWSKKQGGGANVFWGKLILLIRQQFMRSHFSARLEAGEPVTAFFISRASGALGTPPVPKSRSYNFMNAYEMQVFENNDEVSG